MKRNIIRIDEEKCTGCGLCIPNCPEGALQVIDGKVRLLGDLFCDGLGACIGHCPEGAITIEERESEPYDEDKVMENIVRQGPHVIEAHLKHLKDHGERKLHEQAIAFLRRKGMEIPQEKGCCNHEQEKPETSPTKPHSHQHPHTGEKSHGFSGCPGSRAMDFSQTHAEKESEPAGKIASQLNHWPIQMHLVSPQASYFQGKDVLISADCVAYSLGDFHREWLKGKSLVIACPKLDKSQEIYRDKITALIDEAKVNTITVMIMEVPCCMGLLETVLQASSRARRKVPVKKVLVGIQGDILGEEWASH